jgi:hypothetical protein
MVSLKELFGSLDSLKATLETVEGCVEFYKWLMKRGIIKIAGKIDAARRRFGTRFRVGGSLLTRFT